MRRLLFLSASLLVGACTTTSFAPPRVERYHRMTSGSLTDFCAPTATRGTIIDEDVAGARALIRNHLVTYECAMRVAANGRQAFELPAFFSLVGATTLIGLGEAGRKAAFVGQTGSSVFGAGKSYYAPQEQATILRSAVDAIACIQSEASNISAYEVAETAEQEKKQLAGFKRTKGAEITVEQQYFDLIESRLTAINGVAAQRLAQRGTFDAAGVAAQIEQIAQAQRDAEEAREEGQPPPDAETQKMLGPTKSVALALSKKVQLDIDVLRPKLDKCVVRAKA